MSDFRQMEADIILSGDFKSHSGMTNDSSRSPMESSAINLYNLSNAWGSGDNLVAGAPAQYQSGANVSCFSGDVRGSYHPSKSSGSSSGGAPTGSLLAAPPTRRSPATTRARGKKTGKMTSRRDAIKRRPASGSSSSSGGGVLGDGNTCASDGEDESPGDRDSNSDLDLEEENYGMGKIRSVMEACEKDCNLKPRLSYIALVAVAIQSTADSKMLLSEIYQWIVDKFPYYQTKGRSWRNSIRHNLSLNECFIKNGRNDNGKGNYWSVHPANQDDFAAGDFRRRRARRRVRKCNDDFQRLQSGLLGTNPPETDTYLPPGYNGFVPMTSTLTPAHVLCSIFGAQNILTKEEMRESGFGPPLPLGVATAAPAAAKLQQTRGPPTNTNGYEFASTYPQPTLTAPALNYNNHGLAPVNSFTSDVMMASSPLTATMGTTSDLPCFYDGGYYSSLKPCSYTV